MRAEGTVTQVRAGIGEYADGAHSWHTRFDGDRAPGDYEPGRYRPLTDGAEFGGGIVDPRAFELADGLGSSRPGEEARPLHPLQAELIAAAGAILLLVALLFMKWFGLGGAVGPVAPRVSATGSEGAWHTLTLLRWPALVAAAVAFVPLLARGTQRWVGLPRRTYAAVAALGTVATLLLGYRVLIDLPDPNHVVDQKAGAILGLLGALLIVVGGVESMRAHAEQARARRARRRPRGDRNVAAEIARINA